MSLKSGVFSALPLLCLGLLGPSTAGAACTLAGSGTANDPFLIGTYSDLKQLSDSSSCDLTATYRLTADIDASASSGENNGYGFAPIGDSTSTAFAGVFHGSGHVIQNLFILDTLDQQVGLFGQMSGRIDSLGLVGAHVQAVEPSGGPNGYPNVGLFAGENDDTISQSYASGGAVVATVTDLSNIGGLAGINQGGTITFCHTSDSVVSLQRGSSNVGGIVGDNVGDIDNSYSTGAVKGSAENYVGGIAGNQDWAGTLGYVHATGHIVGDTSCQVGGLVGYNIGTGNLCYSTSTVSGTVGAWVGGLVGYNDNQGNQGVFTSSFASGRVTGDSAAEVGGLAGENSGLFANCYASGFVSGADSSFVGGLAGDVSINGSGTIQSSYAADSVVGPSANALGAIAGVLQVSSWVQNAYWNSQSSGISMGFGSIWDSTDTSANRGFTTAQMRNTASFVGFSFSPDSAWTSLPNSYPLLRGLTNDPGVGGTGIVAHRAAVVDNPSLRWVGRDADLLLPSPSQVEVVDLTGRAVVPKTDFAAGSHRLTLPNGNAMLFVLVRSGVRTTTLPLEPLH
jgi:hypothetical protein